jgi:branched-chain amino acid transport system substrate-binding protein
MKRTIGAVACSAVAILAIATSGAAGGTTTTGKSQTVMIGATLPMTGGGAMYGNAMSKGLLAAVKVLNAAKTVPGVTFNTDVIDDQAEPGLAVSEMDQLVLADHAIAIVSAFTTPPIAQLKPASQYQVPVFNGGGNDPSLLSHQWLYNDILSITQEEMAALTYAKDHLGVKRVAILTESDYTQAGIAAIAKVGSQLFPGNSMAQTVDVTTADPTPYINKALAYKPNAIYVALPGTLDDQTLKQLGALGTKDLIVGPSGTFGLADVNSLVVDPQLLLSRQVFNPNATFTAAMKADYPGYTPDLYTGTYYTLGMEIAKAVQIAKESGKISGSAVNKALESLPPVNGCCGPTSFNAQHGSTSEVQLVRFGSHGNEEVISTAPAPAG